ncbi:MAG: hypothetical protein IJ568_04715 [Bacilli bacterium]|nr:hypothetical protein [Bacilli bacterium]
MTNEEIKILCNMSETLQKIEIKSYYTEEDYFNIQKIIDGYNKLKKYFENYVVIDKILNKKIDNHSIKEMIYKMRNRYGHIEDNKYINDLIRLLTKVNKNDIHTLINEIKSTIEVIFKTYLSSDYYKVIMNSKPVITIFELMKDIINNPKSKTDFDRKSKNELRPIFNNFKYDESTKEEFDDLANKFIKYVQLEENKNKMIELYGEENYNELIKMLTDDNYTEQQAMELMGKYTQVSLIDDNED